jgi:hypothetical protein
MKAVIRFKRMWRNREVGSVNSDLGYGVMDTLVRRGIAEFVEPEIKPEVRRERKPRQPVSKEFEHVASS